MNIFVCVYGHAHGEDLRAFSSEEKALAWKDKIAREYWEFEFPEEIMPEKNVGAAYFDLQQDFGEEWFAMTECEVE